MNYGHKLRQIRKYFNLKQEDFAEKINTSRSNVSMLESNDRGISLDVLKNLAENLNVDARFFTDQTSEILITHEEPTKAEMWHVLNAVNNKLTPGDKESDMAHFLTINKPLGELINLLKTQDATVINEIKDITYGFIRGIDFNKTKKKELIVKKLPAGSQEIDKPDIKRVSGD